MRTLTLLGLLASGCAGASSTAFMPSARAQFSAAGFVESYCSGCHQPQYVSPSGRQVALFSADQAWREPAANPRWLDEIDYPTVVRWGDAIRCGVHPAPLPDGCTSLTDVEPGFFTAAEKFPPSGVVSSGGYGQTPPPVCAYAADGHTCPQPSYEERIQMVAWIDAGYPR